MERAHEKVVEADLAELVDDDGRVGEARMLEQPRKQGGLAAAEEAGQHRHGNEIAVSSVRLHLARFPACSSVHPATIMSRGKAERRSTPRSPTSTVSSR